MTKVTLDIEHADLDGSYSTVEGIRVNCTKCGHSVEVFGTSDASARRAAVMMKEECPLGLSNYYDIGDWG
ncbi:hypothetical protein [Pararhizobium sp. PWRC1-1]|uniref:hypothetical protein n=1 Tax=Pararhizobium sp. PWRC1-1 TaxID=2804566 RepID=UPI003CEF5E3C